MNAKTRRDVWFFIFEKLNHKILILKLVLILKLKNQIVFKLRQGKQSLS